MSSHNLPDQLREVDLSTSGEMFDVPGSGYLLAWGATVPADASTGYGKSCLFLHTDAASAATIIYINVGSTTSANFDLFADTGLEAALALTTNGNGASKVGTEDASGFTTAATVEAALDEIYQHILSAQATIPIPLGAVMVSDGTPTAKFASAANATFGYNQVSSKEVVLRWNNHATPNKALFSIAMPQDLDDSADVIIHTLAAMSAGNDDPLLVIEAFFDDGDTDCAGSDDEVDQGTTVTEYLNTIDTGDVPASPSTLTVTMQPADGEIGTDDLLVYGIWIEYTRKILTA